MFELTVINVFSEKRLDFLFKMVLLNWKSMFICHWLFLVPCDVSVHLYILYYLCKWVTQVWNVNVQVWNVKIQVWNVKIQVWNVKVQVWNVKVQVWNVKVQVWNVKIQVWNVKVQVIVCNIVS